jgi:hydroxyacylglutathione hydrolase
MPLDLITIPCLTDNYAYLLHNPATAETALIDAPEVGPITAALDARGWTLADLLITHHHPDHIDGVAGLRGQARVIGAAADAHRLPALDLTVQGGDVITVLGEDCHVIDVPGHTVGHVAFYFPASGLAFTADSLMACGCGRLFEGTPAQMWASLQTLRALPPETLICSGHEYAASNARFAQTIDPANLALAARVNRIGTLRAEGKATLPVPLSEELATNPFLRADDPVLQAAIGMTRASGLDVFTEIRARKDRF